MKFYLDAFSTFFKIGLFTIGGGYAMVPLIEEEVVNKKKWLNQEDFIDLFISDAFGWNEDFWLEYMFAEAVKIFDL